MGSSSCIFHKDTCEGQSEVGTSATQNVFDKPSQTEEGGLTQLFISIPVSGLTQLSGLISTHSSKYRFVTMLTETVGDFSTSLETKVLACHVVVIQFKAALVRTVIMAMD